MSIILPNEAATIELGGKLAQQLTKGTVIFLNGELGAGKTTLVRGVLQALGHQGKVKSPTYTLVEPYTLKEPYTLSSDHSLKMLYHFDLYRMHEPEELEYMGARDYFTPDAICFIEWPEKGKGWLPNADLILELSYHEEARSFLVKANSLLGEEIAAKLQLSLKQ